MSKHDALLPEPFLAADCNWSRNCRSEAPLLLLTINSAEEYTQLQSRDASLPFSMTCALTAGENEGGSLNASLVKLVDKAARFQLLDKTGIDEVGRLCLRSFGVFKL